MRCFHAGLGFLGVGLFLALGSGCGSASGASGDAPSESVDELNSAALRNASHVEGAVAPGGAITIAYDAADPAYPKHTVPYLAVELTPAAASALHGSDVHVLGGNTAAHVSVHVSGAFPGEPKVLVVDENFHVLARSAAATRSGDIASADVSVSTATAGKRFVLVRDQKWAKPMSFRVTAISQQ